ncbi:unnamed protein product [Camellia sinensis]
MHAFCASVSSACKHTLSLSLKTLSLYIYMSTLFVSTSHPHLSKTSIAISITVTDSTSLSQILFKICFDLGQMAKICMNKACQATTTFQWKEGWGLKSGAFATLCFNCGCSIWRNLVGGKAGYVERVCKLHKEFGDSLNKTHSGIPNNDISHGFGPFTANNIGDLQSSYVEHRMGGFSLDKEKFTQLSKSMNANELSHCPQTQRAILWRLHILYYLLLLGLWKEREQNKVPPVKQGKKTCLILPKPPKTGLTVGSDANRGMDSQTRVLRLPDEGRGCNQLLPRYWPWVTDEELQQISGDLNSTVVPLFEKVLSASDASRIGRVVFPKACAEAYFPPISQSEGIPIKIQDIKGKEWTFQFRFWPNNKSRMYVLEGINPCIQKMELQAVTFSRIDPGGKLEYGGTTNEDSLQRPLLIPGKKRAWNIGSKNKRLLMHGEDAMELRLTWEEAQEFLRPPPSAKPTIVMIEDQEFQEYDEPPVFGKSTVFTSRTSGVIGLVNRIQKACTVLGDYGADNALPTLWDSLPTIVAVAVADVIVRSSPLSDRLCVTLGHLGNRNNGLSVIVAPNGGGCLWMFLSLQSGHGWTIFGIQVGCSCSAPDEMNPQELENLLSVGNDFTNCIVCIQLPTINQSEDESNQKNIIPKHVGETSKGRLDLNCQPCREEDTLIEATG